MSVKLSKSNPIYMNRPLTNEEIEERCPSIFATEAHGSRSKERYRFIPTSRVLKALREEGFLPFMVAQSNPRDEGKRGYAKHMIRLRQDGQENMGGEYPEIVYIGSHDGTSASQLIGGYLRLVCTNGLVCGHDMGEIRVPHMGDGVIGATLAGAHKITHQLVKMNEHRENMKTITLTKDAQGVFAKEALALRYGDGPCPIEAKDLLIPRRYLDENKNNIWTVFNIVQENLMKGGIQGWSENNRRTSTREIKGIAQNVNVNRKLWDLAEKHMKLAA